MTKNNKVKKVFVLFWRSQYGTEEIDQFDTNKEAKEMKREYQSAYKEGSISIKMRSEKC